MFNWPAPPLIPSASDQYGRLLFRLLVLAESVSALCSAVSGGLIARNSAIADAPLASDRLGPLIFSLPGVPDLSAITRGNA